jgi:tetratricopeptide (TPR) repeat protein
MNANWWSKNMTRYRLAYVLAALCTWNASLQAAPVEAPVAAAVGHLAPAFATHDAARITHAYRTMGRAALPAAELVESTVNAMGYELLESRRIDAAIRVFELNTGTFPLSANAWDSLAEAKMARGDYDSAIRHYRVALDLDPDSDNALRRIEQMTKARQAVVSDGKQG